jgi:hypothetical protein
MSSIQYSEDPKLRTAQKVVFWTVIGLGGVVAFGLLFGLLIQFLWNATLASMFGFASISFWQAVGLFILAKILFGFGGGSRGSGGQKGKRQQKHKPKHKAKHEENAGSAAEAVPEDVEPPEDADDESFKKFWRAEGREAYDAYLQGKDTQE